MNRSGADAVHDLSLVAWVVLAVARATGWHRGGGVDVVVVVHLLAGLPSAVRRVRQRRRDPVAVVAPVAVGCAALATVRPHPRWAPVAGAGALVVLNAAERTGSGRSGGVRRGGARRAAAAASGH